MNDACSSLTQVLATVDENGNVKQTYQRGLGLISYNEGETTTYYLSDGRGSVTALLKEGSITDRYHYDAYGNLLKKAGSTENEYLYNGESYSETTGLYYQRARYMNPTTGTFISMDAYSGTTDNPVSQHKYLYANANPVMYEDPSGYESLVSLQLGMTMAGILAGGISNAVYVALGNNMRDGLLWDQIIEAFLVGVLTTCLITAVILVLAQLCPIVVVILELLAPILAMIGGHIGVRRAEANGEYMQAAYCYFNTVVGSIFAITGVIGGLRDLDNLLTITQQDATAGPGCVGAGDDIDAPNVDEQSGGAFTVHGNSRFSTRPQHGYEIYNVETGDVIKTGISGQRLNLNGTSPRANSQVNILNRNAGRQLYEAEIVATDMPNRSTALEWEIENALRLWNEGNSMFLHMRPRPWEE